MCTSATFHHLHLDIGFLLRYDVKTPIVELKQSDGKAHGRLHQTTPSWRRLALMCCVVGVGYLRDRLQQQICVLLLESAGHRFDGR